MSISRSGRFKEQKHRRVITEKTFTGLQSDGQTSSVQDPSVSEEKSSEVTLAHMSVCSAPELQNDQWENLNDATVAFQQKEKEAESSIQDRNESDTHK